MWFVKGLQQVKLFQIYHKTSCSLFRCSFCSFYELAFSWAIVTELVLWCNSDHFKKNYSIDSELFPLKKPNKNSYTECSIAILFTSCESEAMPSSSARPVCDVKCRVSRMLPHPSWEAGLEEQPAPGPVYCLSRVCHSTSWCCHMYRKPHNAYLLWQGHGEDGLLFIQHFIQAEVYSERKGLKSVGINGESVWGKYSVLIMEENCCLKPVEVSLHVSLWV